ncbi:hypothetical protein LguiA_027894 [Lonicera macranthoides]
MGNCADFGLVKLCSGTECVISMPEARGIDRSSDSADDEQFTNCSRPYNCGTIQGVRYPFWGGERAQFCGRPDLGLFCDHEKYSNLITTSRIRPTYNQTYRVLNITQSDRAHTMTIVPKDLFKNICPKILPTFDPVLNLNYTIQNYAETVRKLHIFYGCRSGLTAEVPVSTDFKCSINGTEEDGVIFTDESVMNMTGCKMSIVFPISKTAFDELWDRTSPLPEALKQGYDVDYNAYDYVACSACEASGGMCGSDSDLQFLCFCPDKPHPAVCPHQKHGHGRNFYFGPLVVDYLNFLVKVKILNAFNDNGKKFIKVACIGRTCHVNAFHARFINILN